MALNLNFCIVLLTIHMFEVKCGCNAQVQAICCMLSLETVSGKLSRLCFHLQKGCFKIHKELSMQKQKIEFG